MRAVDFGLYATPAYLTRIRHAGLVDTFAIRVLYRHRDRMVGIRFGMSRQLKQAIAFDAFCGMNSNNAEGAARKRTGFIEHDCIDRGKGLQIIAALDQNAELARAANAAEKRKRNADDKRTRAAHYEERKSAENPIAPRAEAEQGRKHRQRERDSAYCRRVITSEARDEILGMGLLFGSVLDQLKNTAHR